MRKRKSKRRARVSNPRTITPQAYSRLLKQLGEYRRKKKVKQWAKLKFKMHVARQRMIAANFAGTRENAPQFKGGRSALKKQMPRGYERELNRAKRTKQGAKMARDYTKFWGLPYPTEILFFPGDGKKSVTYLMGTGNTTEVHLASAPRGEKGVKTVLFGRWKSGKTPKGRIIILSRRKFQPPFRFVGWAPETHYEPTPEMEAAGTFKRHKHWRHKHHDDGGKWAPVYADRNGKLSKDSNFIYGKGTYRIRQWMER